MGVELRQYSAEKQGAIARVAKPLGMHPQTLRHWSGGLRWECCTDG